MTQSVSASPCKFSRLDLTSSYDENWVPLQIYFDTNVYRFIRASDEAEKVQRVLGTNRCEVCASSGNLFETFAIPIESERIAEIETLVQIANRFEERPISWLHAAELRAELRRKRPTWIRQVRFTQKGKLFLRGHFEIWKAACDLNLPSSSAYSRYRIDAEPGVENVRHFQKHLRSRAQSDVDYGLIGPDGQVIRVDMSDPDVYWRLLSPASVNADPAVFESGQLGTVGTSP